MNLEFSKYHGTGNDFIMLDSRNNVVQNLSAEKIAQLCDRHLGIGADGLIILKESEQYAFKMEYYNADGNLASMCGNGGRCAVEFARACGWIENTCAFEAADGLHRASVLPDGRIRLELRDVQNIKKLERGYFLDTGSPHLIIFTDNADHVDVFNDGRKLRYSDAYPDGTNVNFVEILKDGIKVRTYERGVENETLSCGTGVTAAAIASSMNSQGNKLQVKVISLGGELLVEFLKNDDNTNFNEIYLTGSVTKVFEGNIAD